MHSEAIWWSDTPPSQLGPGRGVGPFIYIHVECPCSIKVFKGGKEWHGNPKDIDFCSSCNVRALSRVILWTSGKCLSFQFPSGDLVSRSLAEEGEQGPNPVTKRRNMIHRINLDRGSYGIICPLPRPCWHSPHVLGDMELAKSWEEPM